MQAAARVTMDVGAKKWLYKTAHKNYWRVAHWLEFEDLVQDGYLHFYRVVNKYSGATDYPHLMSLFKITYINHLHNLSKDRTREPEMAVSQMVAGLRPNEDVEFLERCQMSDDSFGPLVAAIARAPELLQKLLTVMVQEGKALRASYRVRRDGTRETVNERLCRLAGIGDCSVDLSSMLRTYLTSLL